MKRIITAVLSLAIIFSLFSACGSDSPNDVVINIGGMTGPTTMGMVRLLSDNDSGTAANNYNFTLAGSADILAPMLITGELDIAAVPANLASVLYNKTGGQLCVMAVNTLGVLYIVEKGSSITSLDALKGQTIYATGQGAAPEYALRYVLEQNGIDPDNDVHIVFCAEPSEVVALMAAGESAVAMLPQPYVTVAEQKIDGLRAALDITEEWDAVGSGSMCLTGVVVAQKEFITTHPEQVTRFLEEYEASIEYTNANIADAAALCGQYEVVSAAVAEKAIPECNITFISGVEMKEALEGYLTVLYEQNPASVGGKLPDNDFYFI